MPDKPLAFDEARYREAKLREIEARILRDGAHVARPHADRARQFMPFAALKGYHEMARSREWRPEERREVTPEAARELSQTMGALRKGDVVRVVHYEDGAYVATVGAMSEVIETKGILVVVRKSISFEDVYALEVVSGFVEKLDEKRAD